MQLFRPLFWSLLVGGALRPALAPAAELAEPRTVMARTMPSGSSGKLICDGKPLKAGGKGQKQADAIAEASIRHNLDSLNALRAKAGVPALKLDARLSDFARQGSLELLRTHEPHGHFKSADVWGSGFENAAAENQGDPHGWTPGPVERSIDQILQMMMDEGVGGGHHDNILNPKYSRVGIGLVLDKAGRLYFTNDFSG